MRQRLRGRFCSGARSRVAFLILRPRTTPAIECHWRFSGGIVTRLSLRRILTIGLALLATAGFLLAFRAIPIEGTSLAIDWRGIWPGLRGGLPDYGSELKNPPWSILPLLPLGFLSLRDSWAVLALITVTVEVLSVSRTRSRIWDWTATILLVTSRPSIRNLADGNLECLTIGGILLALLGYRHRRPWILVAGLLLASAKPQETWLLLVILLLSAVLTWPRHGILQLVAGGALVIVPTSLLYGPAWMRALLTINDRGTVMDSSLLSVLARLGVSSWASWAAWLAILIVTLWVARSFRHTIDREAAAFLVSGSLLLSPYAAGNNVLAVAAIGVVPIFQARSPWGVILWILLDLPYLAIGNPELLFRYGACYATGILLVSWAVFGWRKVRSPQTLGP